MCCCCVLLLLPLPPSEAETSGPAAFSPRTTSLSIVRASKQADAAEERFFQKLEAEVRGLRGGGRLPPRSNQHEQGH